MYIHKVKKTGSGSAAPKEPNVTIVATKDIITWPSRNNKKVLMVGGFSLASNPKIAEIYLTPSKTKSSYESEGDEDAPSIKQKFEGEHPGSQLEINEFIADWLGEPCIVIHGSCQDAFRKVVGTKCAPVQLKASGQDDNDARNQKLVFEQFAKSEWLPGHYTGALPSIEPFEVVSAAALVLTPLNGYVYQLPRTDVGTEIGFGSSSLNHGSIITLIGGGGTSSAVLEGTTSNMKAILHYGTPWVALEKAIINLQVFIAGADVLFIEISRE